LAHELVLAIILRAIENANRMHRCRSLALLCGAWLMAGEAGLANPLPEKTQGAVTALEQAWKSDPLTSRIAFPPITPVAEASRPLQSCPSARLSAPQALALYCPDKGRILIDRQRLDAIAMQFGSWDSAFWLAMALGQAIAASSGQSSGQQGLMAANLQATCFAGTLLGQAPILWPPADRSRLSAAFTAFPSRLNGEQGTPAQRSYALLTGLGGTASDCGATAMANLAAKVVPDPERLQSLAAYPDRSTGNGAIGSVIDALCLPKPPLGCPRRLPQPDVRSNP
jgi:hypothetical protein